MLAAIPKGRRSQAERYQIHRGGSGQRGIPYGKDHLLRSFMRPQQPLYGGQDQPVQRRDLLRGIRVHLLWRVSSDTTHAGVALRHHDRGVQGIHIRAGEAYHIHRQDQSLGRLTLCRYRQSLPAGEGFLHVDRRKHPLGVRQGIFDY